MFNKSSSPNANCPATQMTGESPPPTMLHLVCDDCECSKFRNKPPGSMCICNLRTKAETLSSCQKFCLRSGNAYAKRSMKLICNRNKDNNGGVRRGTRNAIRRVNNGSNNIINNDTDNCYQNGSEMNQTSNNRNNNEEQDDLSNQIQMRPSSPPLSPFFDQTAAKWWWTLHGPDEQLPRKRPCRRMPRNPQEQEENTAVLTAGRNTYNMNITDTTLPGTDTDMRILRFEKQQQQQQQCNTYQNAMGQCQNKMNMNCTNNNNNYYNNISINRPTATPFSIMPNNCIGAGVMNCGCNNNNNTGNKFNTNANLNGQSCRPQTPSMGLNTSTTTRNNNVGYNSNTDGMNNSNKMCPNTLNNPTQKNMCTNNNNNTMMMNGIKTMLSGNNNMMVDSNDRHMNMMMMMETNKNTGCNNGNTPNSVCNCSQNKM